MSTLKVNLIEPFSGGTVTITGATVASASFATSASFAQTAAIATVATSASFAQTAAIATVANGLSDGNKTLNSGALTQNFTAPGQNIEVGFANVTGANVGGRAYNRVFYGMADFSQFGLPFEDYFAIEYYDSFGFNFGSEFNINGKQAQLSMQASGSGQGSAVQVVDNYDGTSQLNLISGNKIQITGKAELSNVLQLAPLDPLPGNGLGQLAVSGSNLFFNDGATWTQIN